MSSADAPINPLDPSTTPFELLPVDRFCLSLRLLLPPSASLRLLLPPSASCAVALLVHPTDDAMLFVAGNADALTWRVDWRNGDWVESSGTADTSDGSYPHSDCRAYFWEPSAGSLLLLSDGGAFMRLSPEKPGGQWRSLAGDTGAMELISAHWDAASDSWVGGAQDNTVMLSPPHATATDRATGFVFGDGTVTAVDSTVTPSRFYGATQFLGNFDDDDAGPHRTTRSKPRRGLARRRRHRRRLTASFPAAFATSTAATGAATTATTDLLEPTDTADAADADAAAAADDAPPSGFVYATRTTSGASLALTPVPLLAHFDIDQIPFFDHPYRLDTTAKTPHGLPLIIWARAGRGKPAGYFRFTPLPNGSFAPPAFLGATAGDVYTFEVREGFARPFTLLVALNDSHLLYTSYSSAMSTAAPGAAAAAVSATATAAASTTRAYPLPVAFSRPIEFGYSSADTYVLGPISHDRTVSLAVSPSSASTAAVSGWTSLSDNTGVEGVWLTTDGGASFQEVTANLRAVTGVCDRRAQCGKWRPSALLLLPQPGGGHALLVGTVSGVYARRIGDPTNTSTTAFAAQSGPWQRLGACGKLPLVLVAGLSHEPSSDTLVAATMGRGVYALRNATEAVARALL